MQSIDLDFSWPATYTLGLAAPLVTVLTERTSATTKQYLDGLGDSPLASYDGTSWTYLSGRNGLNSVRQETDASGNVITARGFDPYGVPLATQGNGGAPFGYTGEVWDNATSLVFLRAMIQSEVRDDRVKESRRRMGSWVVVFENTDDECDARLFGL